MPPQFIFEAIGTKWQIDIFDDISSPVETDILQKIKERIDLFDKHYSRFRADSLVTEMSQKAGSFVLPNDAEKMFSLYQDLYRVTKGAVTPLIGQVLSDAGYDAKYSLETRALEVPKTWDEVIEYNFPNITLKSPALLDFGAAGKGYLIDIVSELLSAEGIVSFCVDAGGDIFYRHAENVPMRVGLEHPLDPESVIGIATIKQGSICGSSGNRRAWGNFHHIIDPRTLSSPRHILALWTIAKTTMIADAMATCLFFVSANELKEYEFEYLIMYADHSIEKSEGFEAELFLEK